MKKTFISIILLCSFCAFSQTSEAKVKVHMISFAGIIGVAVIAGIVTCLNHRKKCEEGYKKGITIAENLKNRAIDKLESIGPSRNELDIITQPSR